MSSSSVCTACLRALRQQARQELQRSPNTPRIQALRAFSTARNHRQQAAPPTKRPPPPPPPPPKAKSASAAPEGFSQLAASLRTSSALRGTTEPYIAYGSTEDLFRTCAAQCNYTIPSILATPPEPAPKNAGGEDIGVGEGWWLTPKAQGGLGLDVTFNAWAQVVMLHMYVLTVRLRGFPAEHAKIWHQNLLDHFFYAAEDRMAVWHGMSARGVRNKYLKDLWHQWRGLLLSYDEGLIKGDAVMAAAVWRNMFKASEDADVGDVSMVTAYLRRELRRVGEMSDDVVGEGKVTFEGAESLKALVSKESHWMQKGFSAEHLKGHEQQ